MNDGEVERQISQMVSFIRQEAEEKAAEIDVAAEEEYNIEKLGMVEEEKRRLRKEFERRDKTLETKKAIAYSKRINTSRLLLLNARDRAIDSVRKEALRKLSSIANGQVERYNKLLGDLITEGVKILGDLACHGNGFGVQCRREDVGACEQELHRALSECAQSIPGLKGRVLSDGPFLPSAPTNEDAIGARAVSCTGGIVVISGDGKVHVDQTFEERLAITLEDGQSVLRARLFPGDVLGT